MNKKRIAVVCARLHARNTGMATVDLAAQTVLVRLFPEAALTLYAFEAGSQIGYSPDELPFAYKDLVQHSQEFFAADVILFWGDFVHSRAYWIYDMSLWDHQLRWMSSADRARVLEKRLQDRARFVFLADASQLVLDRTVVFGSSILSNEAEDDQDKLYREQFRNFYERIGGVFFRDAMSAAKVSPLRGGQATLGCDCALLLGDEEMRTLPQYTKAPKQEGVGVFFGRSTGTLQMMLFARLLFGELGLSGTWLPWFSSNPWRLRLARLSGIQVKKDHLSPGEILSELSGFQFVVTDTYHLCVNAWRMGVPAICIGAGASAQVHSIADKKKEILYEMYGGRQFYVFLEHLSSPGALRREAQRAMQALKATGLSESVCDNIHSHRAAALARLTESMNKALGS